MIFIIIAIIIIVLFLTVLFIKVSQIHNKKILLYNELNKELNKINQSLSSEGKIILYTNIIDKWTNLLIMYEKEKDIIKARVAKSTIELYKIMIEKERNNGLC